MHRNQNPLRDSDVCDTRSTSSDHRRVKSSRPLSGKASQRWTSFIVKEKWEIRNHCTDNQLEERLMVYGDAMAFLVQQARHEVSLCSSSCKVIAMKTTMTELVGLFLLRFKATFSQRYCDNSSTVLPLLCCQS